MNEISWEYLAGLFDGEGPVGIYRVKNKNSEKVYWSVKLSIVGTHKPMIESIYKKVGYGMFTTQKRQMMCRTPIGNVLGKQGWKWGLTSKSSVKDFLEKIYPILIEKKAQADIVLSYCTGKIDGNEASRLCKQEKKFEFPIGEFEEYKPRACDFKGMANPRSKLTVREVKIIKLALQTGVPGSLLAKILNVSKVTISNIKNKKNLETYLNSLITNNN